MITRIFGKIIENVYDVDDKLVQITDENGNKKDVYTGKPAIKKETKVKEWYELCSYEGEPRYNHDFQCLTHWAPYKVISISEDEEVGIEKEIFRADINESHLQSNEIVDEIDVNKANAEYLLDKHINAFNKMMIESNDKLKAYCDIHKLPYMTTDCIELFKLVFPDKLYIIKDGKMKVSDDIYVSSSMVSDSTCATYWGPIVYK